MKIVNDFKKEYTIEFNSLNLEDLTNYFVCIDKRVLHFHKDYLKGIIANAIDYIVIDSTEENKNMNTVNNILDLLFNNNASKNATIVSIGGGICGDICGYVASIYKRGMNYINVPTTLLSQVDSSVGGKVGVNHNHQKNVIGAIYFPKKVIIDEKFLTTLTTRQFKEGLVELIKHGLLVDKTIIEELNKFNNIDELRNSRILDLIKLSIEAKKIIVDSDVFDTGKRHALNLGHSFAHAIELNNDLYHGEAVCWGILVNTFGKDIYSDVKAIFEKFECIKKIENFSLDSMINDKKAKGKIIKEVFLNGINDYEIVDTDINELISKYNKVSQEMARDLEYSINQFIFKPCNLKGEVTIPPSKSILHRYLIASALSESEVTLNGVSSICDDVLVTMNALKQLGCKTEYINNNIKVSKQSFEKTEIDMKESGTSLRVLLPILMHFNDEIVVVGKDSLGVRPMQEYFNIFDKQKIKYQHENYLPLKISGKLSPGVFEVDGSKSSQFISGLLFLLPLLNGDSKIIVNGKVESIPYIKLTLDTLKEFNVDIEHSEDFKSFSIKGNQKYLGRKSYEIEQDYSARSFFEVANSFDNHNIDITNEFKATNQGDAVVKNIVESNATSVDLMNIPDSALILAVYFAVNGGVLHNTNRLQYKESDRLKAIIEFLDVMNTKYNMNGDSLEIIKGSIRGGEFDTYFDHRVTMALIIASTVSTSPFYLKEIKSINKSFPTFIECYEKLGGVFDEE